MAAKKQAAEAVEEVKVEKVEKPAKPDPKRKVKLTLFRDNNQYKNSLYVAVNGKSYMIPRGKEVEVPWNVAKVVERSMAEDMRTAEQLRIMEANYAGK